MPTIVTTLNVPAGFIDSDCTTSGNTIRWWRTTETITSATTTVHTETSDGVLYWPTGTTRVGAAGWILPPVETFRREYARSFVETDNIAGPGDQSAARFLERRQRERLERVAQMQRSVDAVMRSAYQETTSQHDAHVRARATHVQNEARERARALLHRHLSDRQRISLVQSSYFDVRTASGRRYRIRQGRVRNVDQLNDDGFRVATYCAHPGIECPDEDTMLTQLLWLQHDEEHFLRIANRS